MMYSRRRVLVAAGALTCATGSAAAAASPTLAPLPAKSPPYGHARSEYLASLTVAVMILFIGFELAKSSVEKILHPSPVEFSGAVLCVLLFSIVIKMGMAVYNYKMGRKINSMTLKAIADDSRNDVIATSAVVDEDDIVGGGGNAGGPGDVTTPVPTGHISYTLGADALSSVALSSVST